MRKASAALAVALAAILGAVVSAEDKPVASTSQTAREWPATAAELEGLRGLEREFRELQARSSAFLDSLKVGSSPAIGHAPPRPIIWEHGDDVLIIGCACSRCERFRK